MNTTKLAADISEMEALRDSFARAGEAGYVQTCNAELSALYAKAPAEPSAYISAADGMWTVIYDGVPLMASTTDGLRALAVARVNHVQTHTMYNGETGRFIPFTMGAV